MNDENSTTPQPDQQPPATQPTEQLPPANQPTQPTQQLPVSGPAPAQHQAPAQDAVPEQSSNAEQPSNPAQPSTAAQAPAPTSAPAQAPGSVPPSVPVGAQAQHGTHAQHGAPVQHGTPAQHPVPAQNAAPAVSPASGYVNPYSAPATASGGPHSKPANRAWVPVVSAAAAAALLASLGTAGVMSLTNDSDTRSSLADVGQTASQNVPVKSSTVENPDWTAVTSAVQESVVAIQVESQAGGAEGSGVVLDSDGRILTNNHVVADASTVQVTLSDGRVYDADIVGTDPATDLAVVQLSDPPSDLKPAKFGDSSDVVVGEPVMALGNPLGLANTATTGIVSALDRPVAASGEDGTDQVVTNAIQIDAAVNPGNSGGPLFNASGEVIGITSSIATLSGGMQSGSSGSIGLGFAIPSNLATQIGDQLKADGTAEHAFLGVSLEDATATADGVTRRGAGVVEVTPDSPASDAGIQQGDVIVAIDGDPVNGSASLTAFVREKEAGDESVLTVVRDGNTQEVTVTLAVRDESAVQDQGSQDQQLPGQEDGSGSGSDQSAPNNIPDWLQEFLPGNQG
jgi:putative serine protease PepD